MDAPDQDLALVLSIFEELRRIAPEMPEDNVGFGFPNGMSIGEVLRRLRTIPSGAGAAAVETALGPAPRA